VDVVLDVKPLRTVSGSCAVGSDVALEPVLGALDLGWAVLVVIVGIDIEIGDVVTKISHVGLALAGAAGVWRAHVGGDLANDIAESHFVLPHLVLAVEGGDDAQVQVRPGVGSDLVAFGVHALDHVNVLLGQVDLALVDVVASDEEGRLGIVGLHEVQDVGSEDFLWAVIVGQGNGARRFAVINTGTTIRDRSDLGAGDRRGVGASRNGIVRAARTVSVVATRSVAVIAISTTVWSY
jgi:hypothetical protein